MRTRNGGAPPALCKVGMEPKAPVDQPSSDALAGLHQNAISSHADEATGRLRPRTCWRSWMPTELVRTAARQAGGSEGLPPVRYRDAAGPPAEQAILYRGGVMQGTHKKEPDNEQQQRHCYRGQARRLPIGVLVSLLDPAPMIQPGHVPTCSDQPTTRRPTTLPFSGRGARPIAATQSCHSGFFTSFAKSLPSMPRGSLIRRSAMPRSAKGSELRSDLLISVHNADGILHTEHSPEGDDERPQRQNRWFCVRITSALTSLVRQPESRREGLLVG
jgi:hypothetical protein